MNRDRDTEKEIIDFLMSYPEAVPSMQEKARTVTRLQREIRKGREARMKPMDILFILFFLAATLLLWFSQALLSELSATQLLNQIYQLSFWHQILLYIGLTGLITAPLLLTIIPINKGGNN